MASSNTLSNAPPEAEWDMMTEGTGLSREDFPYLVSCLAYLELHHDFCTDPLKFEARYLAFVRLYSYIVHWAGHHMNGDSLLELTNEIKHGKAKYAAFIRQELDIHGSNHPDAVFPEFDNLFQELVTALEPMEEAFDFCSIYPLLGKQMAAYEIIAFECTVLAHPKYTLVLGRMLEKEPVYTDLPSDYDKYVSNRASGQDPFFGLSDALKPFIHNYTHTRSVFVVFGGVLAYTVDLFAATSYAPSPAQVNVLLDTCVRYWSYNVGAVLNDASVQVRTCIAAVNVRGVVDVLVELCREILKRSPSEHLGWHVYAWFFNRSISSFVSSEHDPNVQKNAMHLYFDLQLLNPRSEPRESYTPATFEIFHLSREALEEANHLEDLDDVRFEPDGPPSDPHDYTDPLLVGYEKTELCVVCQCELEDESAVKLRACGHIMHLDCVRSMINGIHDSANLCPLDRMEICPRRPRRPVLNPNRPSNNQAAPNQSS